MKYDFMTIGGATEDITFYTEEGVLINDKKSLTRQKLFAFEYGAKIKVDQSFTGFGGGAANTAVCFARLGFKTACLAAIGNDSRGQRILDNFIKQGVATELIQKKRVETGFSFLVVGPKNEHVCFSNRAANSQLKITNYELRIAEDARWVYLTSLSGNWQSNLDKIFSVKAPRIAWNPGHRQILAGVKILSRYFKRLDCLIVNKDEAIELVMSDSKYKNKKGIFLNNTKNLLAILSSYGPKIAITTNGEYGADVITAGKVYHRPIIKAPQSIDTTGVGDAFGSSFVAGLELYNQDIKQALWLAAKNSSAEVGQQGAQNGLLRRKDI